ncbi:hypothetical protein GCM10011588_01750 [Nocardia jinanensis]|uniref:Uncharacterized protein n=1 Tax=Nocardia jinanensis TaxID=382504 RepID=A0A917VJR0_9NOCA|nr:hypothetical protein GCM10011588_01750 [Nocardia jinanensis]
MPDTEAVFVCRRFRRASDRRRGAAQRYIRPFRGQLRKICGPAGGRCPGGHDCQASTIVCVEII